MATCRACNSEVPAGIRWCGICHANLIDPRAGKLASPAKRLGAHVLDLAVPIVAFVIMLSAFGVGLSTQTEAGGTLGFLVALALFIAYVVWAFKLFAHGVTPGKKILGIRVIKENGEAAGFGAMLIREWVGKWISTLLFALGFLWILFDRDRQGWHDKLMSTYVVE